MLFSSHCFCATQTGRIKTWSINKQLKALPYIFKGFTMHNVALPLPHLHVCYYSYLSPHSHTDLHFYYYTMINFHFIFNMFFFVFQLSSFRHSQPPIDPFYQRKFYFFHKCYCLIRLYWKYWNFCNIFPLIIPMVVTYVHISANVSTIAGIFSTSKSPELLIAIVVYKIEKKNGGDANQTLKLWDETECRKSFRGHELNRENLIINTHLPEHQQTLFVINQLNCNGRKWKRKNWQKLKKIGNL